MPTSTMDYLLLVQSILLHPLGGLLGIICQDDVGPCPLEACQCLQHHVPLVEPTPLDCRLQHGVFPANVIRRYREVRRVLQPAYDVKVRHSRLDHQHVSTLLGVKCRLNERLPTVRRILLVCLLIAKSGMGVESVPERS